MGEAGAIGTSVAYLVYVPGHMWLARKVIDVPLRPLAGTLVRCLGAAVAMGLALMAAGTSDLSLAGWIIGTLDEAGERLAAFARAGVQRVMLQDFLPRDLSMIQLMGRLGG